MPDKVRLDNDRQLAKWVEGHPVSAAWSDTVIGTILSTGKDEDGFYALVELTPEARGIPPAEDVEDDAPFG